MVEALEAIDHLPLNQRTYRKLRAFVLSGAVKMGERLDEKTLSEQLGVSRTPVREAISRLVQEQLVEYRPFQGNFVRTIPFSQVKELFDVRKSLEGLAARRAVEHMTDDRVEEIAGILEDAHSALMEGDLKRYTIDDARFHQAVVSSSGSETLCKILEQLSAQIQIARVIANRDETLVERTAAERPLILEALRSRDANRAGELMEAHIQGVFDSLTRQLADHGQTTDTAHSSRDGDRKGVKTSHNRGPVSPYAE